MGDTTAAAPNTLPAFEDAVRSGVHMIEIDVSVTVDGIPVATHGPRLEHWTDGSGKVHRVQWEAISQLNARLHHRGELTDESVPSVGEVLQQVGGRLPVNLDIKRPAAIGPTVELVEAGLSEQWGVLSGLVARQVRRMLRQHPDVPVLLNLTRLDKLVARSPRLRVWWLTRGRMRRLLSRPQVVALNVPLRWADRDLVDAVHRHGAQLWVFTATTQAEIDAAVAFGADSITIEAPSGLSLGLG